MGNRKPEACTFGLYALNTLRTVDFIQRKIEESRGLLDQAILGLPSQNPVAR